MILRPTEEELREASRQISSIQPVAHSLKHELGIRWENPAIVDKVAAVSVTVVPRILLYIPTAANA